MDCIAVAQADSCDPVRADLADGTSGNDH